jgi:glycosyltransferase involved in cell wall biosynthesis
VALLRDFDEARLFGVRLYADRMRQALAKRCEVVDVYPWPKRAAGPRALWPIQTLLVKELFYPVAARRLRADLFHVVDQSHTHLVRSLRGAATVVTCHDLWGLRHGGRVRRFLYRRRVLSLKEAGRVVAVSQAARVEAIELGVEPRRVAVVRNRVDPFFLEDPPAAELAATAERFDLAPRAFFLHVGNNLPYKNIEGLLRALGELGRVRRHEPRLVKVGAAPSPKQHRLAAACGVALRWIGEISASELRSVYHLAQCLVYPSLDEGFGWPVAEALACGLPVVAGRRGALPEIAGDAAILVDPTEAGELVAALVRLVEAPEMRAELAARGRARGAWLAEGDVGGELLEVYEAALAERGLR